MVDGGKGQLSSAIDALSSLGIQVAMAPGLRQDLPMRKPEERSQPVIGLAKRLEEVFLPGAADPQSIAKSSAGLKLLQRIRDEAHRFAITFHRELRSKRTLRTELDLIKGVGKKRAKELLETFGSVQGVKFATEEQLSEAVGSKIAERIKEYFSEE